MVLCGRSKPKSVQLVRVPIGDSELARQELVKYLGVKIDQSLTWKLHIEMKFNGSVWQS